MPGMTADKAHNTKLTDSPAVALSIFTGFIYTTTISLVIKTAYTLSSFDSVGPIVFTLLVLLFFVFDAIARYRGRHKLSQETTKNFNPFYLFFLELLVIYFLLLVFLRFIEIIADPTLTQVDRINSGRMLCYMTAIFATLSGAWNIAMIIISKQLTKRQICSLFKGHLDPDIMRRVFPDTRKWRRDFLKRLRSYKEAHTRLTEIDWSAHDGVGHVYRIAASIFNRILVSCMFVGCIARKPHHLIVPYILVTHIMALNFVLSVSIIVSACLPERQSLFSHLFGEPTASFVVLLVLLVSLSVGALLFLGIHLTPGKSLALFEQLGYACLVFTILLLYSLCPAVVLFFLIFSQQVAANIFMTRYFDPSVGRARPETLKHKRREEESQS